MAHIVIYIKRKNPMAEAKKSSGKKIVDVAHPGKTAPSGNSKSVIVTSRPIMKDPMVVESEDSTEDSKISVKTGGAVIEPISDDPMIEKDESKEEPELKGEDDKKTIAVLAEEAAVRKEFTDGKDDENDTDEDKKSDSPVVEQSEEAEPVVAETEQPKSEEEPLQDKPEDNNTDPESDEKQTSKTVTEAEEAEAAEQEKRDTEIQKLIDSKKYELPINSVETRRSKRVVIIGIVLSILLVLAWLDIALDASLIQVDGIKPVTHFFSN
jgi:hypothetical protein